MKNKLKEMLLKHKPISEETSAIEDIWGETVADGAEDFEEIPEGGTPQEDKIVVDVPEEVDEDIPAEENKHTIANAIEESWLPSVNPWLKYRNSRIKANTKKVNKTLGKLDNETDADKIKKLEDKAKKKAAKIDYHEKKYNNIHDEIYQGVADKVLSKPGYAKKMISDPKKLRRIPKPALFAAQVENRAKSYNQTASSLVKTATEWRDDLSAKSKQLEQVGKTPEHKEAPKVAPATAPATAPITAQAPHQRVANDAAAAKERLKERLSKVRATM